MANKTTVRFKKDYNFGEVWRHIEITNSEMGCVKSDIQSIKTDIGWLKSQQSDINNRLWYTVAGIAISIGVGIFGILIK